MRQPALTDEGGRPLMVHGTAIALGNKGVLLRGAAGSGKSDLALRLIDAGAILVADDQTVLARRGDSLVMSAPLELRGMLEVRGLGIIEVPVALDAPLTLVVDLTATGNVTRLPESSKTALLGVDRPSITLAALEASAVIKVKLALAR